LRVAAIDFALLSTLKKINKYLKKVFKKIKKKYKIVSNNKI